MKRTMLMAAVLVLLGACAHSKEDASHLHHAGGVHHRFENAEQWAQRFEDPKRDEWQKPDEVIAALAVPKDGRVADIGAATGYFPVRISRAHPDATVYGVDIEPDMTKYLTERAQREGLPNVKAVLGEAADPKLPEQVDRVLWSTRTTTSTRGRTTSAAWHHRCARAAGWSSSTSRRAWRWDRRTNTSWRPSR